MIIPITINPSSSNPKLPSGLAKISHDELVLVELQGSLEVECNNDSERNGKLVGKLSIDDVTNKPTLRIGHHLLEGKIATLPKPLAVLLRSSPASASNLPTSNHDPEDNEMMDCDPDPDFDSGKGQDLQPKTAGWDVVAIVKRKIVFSKRPMPIVGHQT